MLHALTLLPLTFLAPAPTVPTSGDLLSAIPDTALIAVHGSNPKALIASRDTNDWVAFALDAEWNTIIDQFAGAADQGVTAKEIQSWRNVFIGAMADTTGFVGFVDFADDWNDPVVGLIAHGGAECQGLLRQMVGEGAATIELGSGRSALVGEAGRAELFYEGEGLVMILSAGSIDKAKELADTCLNRLGNPDAAGPFAIEAVGAERRDAAFEFAVNLQPVWARVTAEEAPMKGMEKRAFDSVSSVDWLYGSVSFGDGETADWEFVAPFAQESLLGDLLGFFGSANTATFGTVPSTATQATIGSFDVAGAVDWALGLVKEQSEDDHAQVMGGIEAAGGMLGMDLMNDVIKQFDGQFLYFNSNESIIIDGTPLPGAQAPTAVVFMRETEAMIDVIEQVLQMSGHGASMVSDERELVGKDEGIELWRPTKDAQLQATVGLGAQRLIVSAAPKALNAYFDLLDGTEGTKSMLADKRLEEAAKRTNGAIVSLQATDAMADVISQLAETYASFITTIDFGFGEIGRSEEIGQMVAGADRVAGLIRQYFDGSMTTEFKIEPTRMRVVSKSR